MPNNTRTPRTVAHFDSIAEQYDSLYDDRTPGGYAFLVRRKRVLELFDKPGGKVLDVGCGTGVIADHLLAQNCAFWGIDPSPNMIEQARTTFRTRSNAHFSVGSAEEIEFPDEFFDAVICMGVVERVKDNDLVLKEMVRVLKRGGTLLITLPNKFSPYYLWRDFIFYPVVSLVRPFFYRYSRSGEAKRSVIPGHTLYSAGTYADAVARNGCLVSAIEYCVFSPLLSPLDSLFPRAAVWAMRKLEALRDGMFRHTGACMIVKARKQ